MYRCSSQDRLIACTSYLGVFSFGVVFFSTNCLKKLAKINGAFSDLREKKKENYKTFVLIFWLRLHNFFNMAYVEWREEDEGRREMPQERGFIPEYEGKQNTRLPLDFEELSTKLQKNISTFVCSFLDRFKLYIGTC